MRDKRRIIIKNPLLRNFRNNLRRLIIHAVYEEIHWLNRSLIEYDHNYPNLIELEMRKRDLCHRKVIQLERSLSRSICECSACTKSGGDRVYIAEEDMWFCTDCEKKDNIWTTSRILSSPKFNYVSWYYQQKERASEKIKNFPVKE